MKYNQPWSIATIADLFSFFFFNAMQVAIEPNEANPSVLVTLNGVAHCSKEIFSRPAADLHLIYY